ncbi:MAG TPA: hypothetical protein VFJ85_01700 [Acidimicrobiales bacterium]|nr:hypothetical protein [Acidimicrobiales bacterium]
MLRRRTPHDGGNGSSAADTLRTFVFGDRAVDEWPPPDTDVGAEPWRSFVLARSALARGAYAEAQQLWWAIAERQDIGARQVLQAWHFLRSVGVAPDAARAKQVLGAVAEVAVPQGHDLLVVYADGSVRYLNFSGAAVAIEQEIPSVAGPAREFLAVGQSIVGAIGPWEGPLPPLPAGHSRLTMLTPSGPHFGQGPDDALRSSPPAAAFFDAATRTLLAVLEVAQPR